jgi:hypothetical protein
MSEPGPTARTRLGRLAIGARLGHLPRGRDLRAFFAVLRSPERASACRALRDGVIVTWTLRRRGVRPLLTETREAAAVVDASSAIRVSAAVDAGLAMLPLASTCLRRSLVLLPELHRRGLVATLHVGVRNVAARAEAHAWVQVGETAINDDAQLVATYTQLAAGDLERLLPLMP